MREFSGFVLFCGSVLLLPVPATMLFRVDYPTALGAAVVGVLAAVLSNVGVSLMKG